jgi:hypothetical protein
MDGIKDQKKYVIDEGTKEIMFLRGLSCRCTKKPWPKDRTS